VRALITGLSGFAGSHLAEYLLRQPDVEVSGVVFGPVNQAEHLLDRVQAHQIDLTDEQATRRVLSETRPDYIFHLAGQAFVPASWADPWQTLANNIRAQVNLLHGLVQLESAPRFLAIGSNEEYGRVSPDRLPIDEATPLRPNSPYGVSKITQDYLGLQYFISHQLPIVRVRPFNHIGPRQDARFFAADFARQIAEAEAGKRDLDSQRDFTDVRDMVRGYVLALERGEPGEVYNIGSGKPRSVRELLDGFLKWAKVECKVEVDPARLRPSDTPVSYCDARKFQKQTGWSPQIPIEETLRDILDDARERVRNGQP
jgi:GDP-4-dehydro-6-deoxy-D-mannose reductase